MKKILILWGVCLLFANSQAQTDTTCSAAKSFALAIDGVSQPEVQSNQSIWYAFTAQNDSAEITLSSYLSFSDKVKKIILWSGDCSSLINISSDSASSLTDSVFNLSIQGLTFGNTYYLQVFKGNNVDTAVYKVLIDFQLLTACGTCASSAITSACNLVCNGNFEYHTGCPTGTGGYMSTGGVPYDPIPLICAWTNASTESPDYYNSCYTGSTGAGVPVNNIGTQASHNTGTSNGYIGLYAWGMPVSGVAYHEYIYEKLRYPLITGVTYKATMWVSLAERSDWVSSIGMYFSSSPTTTTVGLISVTPQITSTCSAGGYITDRTNWVKVEGTILGAGQQYLLIGGFTNTYLPATPPYPYSGVGGAYYYIDEVSVTPLPFTVNASPNPICLGQTTSVSTVTTPGTCPNTTTPTVVSWSSVPTSSFAPVNGASSIATPSASGTTTITASANYNSGCTVNVTKVITVNPSPLVTVNSPAICTGQTANLVANGATSYVWSAGATVTGVGTANASPGATTSYTVTGTTGACSATALSTVTVNSTPIITSESNLTYCNGASVPINTFASTPSGATFSWSNSNTAIGLAASGTGDLPAFTATNATTAAISGTITVTPALNGCTGTPLSFTITVSPTPNVNSVSNSTICAGGELTIPSFTGSVSGTTFNWTNSNTAIGLAASGTGDISAFAATNTTTAAIVATITVTPVISGCNGTPISFTITVNPAPVITAEPNLTYCKGASVPLNSFTSTLSHTSYSWTNSNTAIGLAASGSGSVPAFTATNSTTFPIVATITVTGTTLTCTGPAITYTITVQPTPVMTAPSNITVCNGATVAASSFSSNVAGSTYSWTNSNTAIGLAASGTGNFAAFTATNPGSTPITATITVTPFSGACPGSAVTYTITVNPTPTVTASAPTSINLGSSTTLTSTSSTGTYTWTPAATLSNATISNPVATPTSTTTYTVSTSANSYGCSASATTTVTVLYPECGLTINTNINSNSNSSAVFGSGSITVTNTNIHIAANVTLSIDNTAITFSGCNFSMEAGAKIDVLTAKTLTITDRTHLFACNDMWDGIYVETQAYLNITNNSFIEDATDAVVGLNSDPITINTAIFNRNYTSVDIRSTLISNPVSIVNSIFTSRYIPSFVSTGNASNYSVAGINSFPLTGFPVANMQSPYSLTRSPFGIIATDVLREDIGSASSGTNIFDNLGCGIQLIRSKSKILNNTFQNMRHENGCPGCATLSGIAIDAAGTATGSYTLAVGGSAANELNTFSDVYSGVNAVNCSTTAVVYNTVTNSSTHTGTTGIGDMGFNIQPAQNNTIDVEHNSVTNCVTGVWINRNNSNSISTQNLTVDNNTISANSSGFCTTGVYVTDLSAGTTVVPTISEIAGNTITETANCINLSNVKKPLNVQSNSVTVKYATTGPRNGIKAAGCDGVSIVNNHTKYNNVGGTAYTSGGNILAYGIYLQNSINMLVKCNQVDDAARSLVFSGTCSSSLTTNTSPTVGITTNTMRRAQDGFVLMSTGIIGTQGSGSVASNNYWDMTTTPTFINQTYCDNSNAASSVLYVTNTTTGANATRPTTNSSGGASGFSYVWTTSLISSQGTPDCSGLTVPAMQTNTGGVRAGIGVDTTYANELALMVTDSSILPVFNDASHWQRLDYVYNQIRNNLSLTVNPVLDSFYTANTNTAYGKFAEVLQAITDSSFSAAGSINNSFQAVNVLEQNQQSMNNFILQKLVDTNYVYTVADSSSLYDIALQCPLAGGNAVYQARNLLMGIANTYIEFPENCNEEPTRSHATIASSVASVKQEKAFRLYPNPNNGNMTLDYALAENEKGKMIICDVTGKIISEYILNNASNKLVVSNDQLNNGVYFYHVILNNRIVKSDKIVVIK